MTVRDASYLKEPSCRKQILVASSDPKSYAEVRGIEIWYLLIMLQPRFLPFGAGLLLGALILLIFNAPKLHISSAYPSRFLNSYSPNQMSHWFEDVENSTLGFQKLFAVGLPERSDKRDALTLISSLVGFKVDWIDGVKGESVPDKALPYGVDRVRLWENNLGSWRGHMNAVRRYGTAFDFHWRD